MPTVGLRIYLFSPLYSPISHHFNGLKGNGVKTSESIDRASCEVYGSCKPGGNGRERVGTRLVHGVCPPIRLPRTFAHLLARLKVSVRFKHQRQE